MHIALVRRRRCGQLCRVALSLVHDHHGVRDLAQVYVYRIVTNTPLEERILSRANDKIDMKVGER